LTKIMLDLMSTLGSTILLGQEEGKEIDLIFGSKRKEKIIEKE